MVTDHLKRFWWFVSERDRIWARRKAGYSEPWTDDLILRDYHFTNIHRYKDPGTRFIVDFVRDHDLTARLDVLFAVYTYRGLNRQDTFERFGIPGRDPLELAAWTARLEEARKAGASLGSGRHLTFWTRHRSKLPILARARSVADDVWRAESVADVVRIMSRADLAVGPFFGTQITADLVTIAPRGLLMDRYVRPPVAGGSRFGLRLVANMHSEEELARAAYDERSSNGRKNRDIRSDPEEEAAFTRLLMNQPSSLSEPLTPIDLEHCLCEYARYARLAAGDTTRARYLMRDRT